MAGKSRVVTRVLSGIQPSGVPHLGNYLGALRMWTRLQDFFEEGGTEKTLYMVADLHALTTSQDPAVLRQNTIDTTATLLACGVDPKKASIFQQSRVPAHSELAWILICCTPMGWANQMTQYKDKVRMLEDDDEVQSPTKKKRKDALRAQFNVGLLAYPSLMAADILLYQASHVPVGLDQEQHLELAQDLAKKVNHLTKDSSDKPLCIRPSALFPPNKNAARIMSLRDGTKKMSKSDVASNLSCLFLSDSLDEMETKIRKAKTDPLGPINIGEDSKMNRPELFNLMGIIAGLEGLDEVEVHQRYAGDVMPVKLIKSDLLDCLKQHIVPIGDEIRRIKKDRGYLDSVIEQGSATADAIASESLQRIKKGFGLL